MTKTQAALLETLARRGFVCVETYHGHGGKGGRISGGAREINAAIGLVKKGLLVRKNHTHSVVYNHGYGIHISASTFVAPQPPMEAA